MKKFFIALSLIISNSLFGANCDNLLKEADKYLSRVALCEATADKHATIALAYYKDMKFVHTIMKIIVQIIELDIKKYFK